MMYSMKAHVKARVTITLDPDVLQHVDRGRGKRGPSRSQVIESILRESQKRSREEDLAALAKEFFSTPESAEETAERRDMLLLTAETWKHDR